MVNLLKKLKMRKRYIFTSNASDETDIPTELGEKDRSSIYSVHLVVGLIFVICLGFFYYFVYLISEILPTPLYISDEAKYPHKFITERAHNHLKKLTDFGPRIAGSYENEILTVNYLKEQVDNIINRSNKNQFIEYDVQISSGALYIDSTGGGKIFAYSNVQNFIVKVHGKNDSQNSLVINAHFDSVPTSPGGTDDGINVAIMLEVLRLISQESDRPLHNVIFLFNGAEETGLQGAHSFTTQHKWATDCKVIINLEGAGVGGKLVLFQTGPNKEWLMSYYKKVPHPSGQVSGEEMFQSNVIPSDTDFRIFRDYGGMVGLDMAFVKNGYLYHTKYDTLDAIPLGCFQNAGDNILSLVKTISNAPELSESNADGNVVYYDFFGAFMIYYKLYVAHIVNSLTIVISVGIFIKAFRDFGLGLNKQTIKYISILLGAILLSWILGIGFAIVMGLILDSTHFSMRWYTQSWIIGGLYVIPTFVISGGFTVLIKNKNLSINVTTQLQIHLIRLIWTIVLLILTILSLRSAYILLIPILFNSLIFVIINLFQIQHSVRKWQIIYVIGMILPTMMIMTNGLSMMALFIPLSGRMGSNVNVELIIAALSAGITVFITSTFVPLITLIRKNKIFMLILSAIFVIALIITFTPLTFPYSYHEINPTPQRHWTVHSSRIIHNEHNEIVKNDSGFFMLNMDRNSPQLVKKHIEEFKTLTSSEEDCKNYVFCGYPLAHSKISTMVAHSTWLSSDPPILPVMTKFVYDPIVTQLTPTRRKYDISIAGPNRISLYLSPLNNVKLYNISLLNAPPTQVDKWNGRDIYFVMYLSANGLEPLNLNFEVETSENINSSSPAVELAISGIHVNDLDFTKTKSYEKFLNSFPDWTDVTAYLGTYESWII